MEPQYFLISFLASTLGAVSGIGGGVIIKPTLDTFSSLSVPTISFLSGCTVLAMTIATLLRSRNLGIKLDKRTSLLLALGSIFGGLAGTSLFELMLAQTGSEQAVGALQSILLAVMVFGVLLFLLFKKRITPKKNTNTPLTLVIGLILGGIAAFLGIGGGPINIVVLYLAFSMNAKEAALNSIYIIFLSQSASLLLTIAGGLVPPFQPAILITMIIGGITGGISGTFITRRISLPGVDRVFGAVLFIILGLSVYNFIQLAG